MAIDSGRLSQLGLPVTAITDALRAGGADLPAGAVHSGSQRLNVEAGGAFRTLEEVAEAPVRAADGRVVRVRDVDDSTASVRSSSPHFRRTISTSSMPATA